MKIACLIPHEYLIMLGVLTFTTRQYLIGVTTKNFELALVEIGRHQNTYPLQHDEEKDDDLEIVIVSNWHSNTHLGINNGKEKK